MNYRCRYHGEVGGHTVRWETSIAIIDDIVCPFCEAGYRPWRGPLFRRKVTPKPKVSHE